MSGLFYLCRCISCGIRIEIPLANPEASCGRLYTCDSIAITLSNYKMHRVDSVRSDMESGGTVTKAYQGIGPILCRVSSRVFLRWAEGAWVLRSAEDGNDGNSLMQKGYNRKGAGSPGAGRATAYAPGFELMGHDTFDDSENLGAVSGAVWNTANI
jgi:hypothetical protein